LRCRWIPFCSVTKLACILLCAVALSLSAAPKPAPVDVDLSTPRAAVRTLVQAVDAQDRDAILKTFYFADQSETELAHAFAELMQSAKKLGDAAREQFGASPEGLASGMMNPAELAHLDQADLKENGDTATLTPLGQSRPLRFHRTANRWQLVIRDFANPDDTLERQARLLRKVTGVFAEITTDISAGKYDGSTEAEAAIQTQLASVLIRSSREASSRPATTQATQPTK
jgi:hypothetical protein